MEDKRIYAISGLMIEQKDGINPFGGYFVLRKKGILGDGDIRGLLVDRWGNSLINGNWGDSNFLKFEKDYSEQKTCWDYEFNQNNEGIWEGTAKLQDRHYSDKKNLIFEAKAVCQIFPTHFCIPQINSIDTSPCFPDTIKDFIETMNLEGFIISSNAIR